MSVLTDLLPPKARKYVYAVLALGALVWTAYQANDGNWGQAAGSLLVTLVNALATANTDTKTDQEG